ncbi:GntR family transcriptional regulator, partial [Methylobacterium frigidaeris]
RYAFQMDLLRTGDAGERRWTPAIPRPVKPETRSRSAHRRPAP